MNADQYTIYVDQNTGYITRIINPDLKDQKYCYHPSYNKIMYHKDESDYYTRYEYDFSRAGYPLIAVVRNACPFTEGSCAKQTCSNTELVWQYDYYTDNYGMPVKLKKILAPAGFQSWQYVYYDDSEPPNPKWSLKAIYRFEADPDNGYIRKGGITDCADNNWTTCKLVASYTYYENGLLNESTDANNNVTTYTYHIDGEIQSIKYPPNNNDDIIYAYSYDPLGRLKDKAYSTGGGVIYTYYGQMLQNVQIKDSSDTVIRTTNYNYDEFFRCTEKSIFYRLVPSTFLK